MHIRNGLVFTEKGDFEKLDIEIENGIIVDLESRSESDSDTVYSDRLSTQDIDASGKYVVPGFIDIHTHGCVGYDTSTADTCGLKAMAVYQRSSGVLYFCPTSMTLSRQKLEIAFDTVKKAMESHEENEATILGINMEGPFVSANRLGAQRHEYVTKPDFSVFESLQKISGNNIRLITIAPEENGAMELIENILEKYANVVVSLGHTDADYETCTEAFKRGANHVTHLFNAMPPLNHRKPGLIGAAADKENAFAEFICDGVHIHPSVIRRIYDIFGADRLILISDSMEGTGMPDGEYELGGQIVIKTSNLAVLKRNENETETAVKGDSNTVLAGSVTNLFQCFKNAVSFGIPLEAAVKMATINPAKSIGLDSKIGVIGIGREAKLLLLDESLNIRKIIG
ncbi:MAG: N-acetylglucosamine-6-phosphate deacetylase [Lachnospiraceae bacterium]|nr:N-acetylglucosamine-6-phosphate deacetylase [Lachnospiraceae bacterium]